MTNATSKPVVKNADSKPAETPKTQPEAVKPVESTQPVVKVEETKPAESPKSESSDVKPASETTTQPVESAKSESSQPAETSAESVAIPESVELTREFFTLLGQTVKNAENKVKTVKIGGSIEYSSVNQSNAIATVRGDNSIVVRKFTPNAEVKDKDGKITQESETDGSGELTEAGKDRKETIRQYMEWYYNPPLSQIGSNDGFEDSEEQTLVENGAILNAVNLIHKMMITGSGADALAGIFILQSIDSWEESNWLMFDYALRSVVIDGVSFAGVNLCEIANLAHMRYETLDNNYGFSVVSESNAKSEDTPRKRNRSAVAGMIKNASQTTPAEPNKTGDQNTGNGQKKTPTGEPWNPTAHLDAAKAGKPESIVLHEGDNGAPQKIASETIKTENENSKPAENKESTDKK